MRRVGDAKLAAESERWHPRMVDRAEDLRIGHGTQQVAHEVVEFAVGDEMCGLLAAERSAEHARKAQQGVAAAGQAIGLAAGTDQLTLNAEGGGLQRDKIDVLECGAVYSLAKHDCSTLASNHGAIEGKQRANGTEVTALVPHVEKTVQTQCFAEECADCCSLWSRGCPQV